LLFCFSSGLNGMPTSPDPFDEFLRQLAPLMQSPKFPSLKKSPPVYESLEFACVAARRGNEWILLSGKAALSTKPASGERIKKVVALDEIVALQGCMPAGELSHLISDLRNGWVLKRENIRLTAGAAGASSWRPPHVIKTPGSSSNGGGPGILVYRSSSSGDTLPRLFALYGHGPNASSLLGDHTLRKIDSQLRLSTPAFNRIDGLCGNLGCFAGELISSQRSNLQPVCQHRSDPFR